MPAPFSSVIARKLLMVVLLLLTAICLYISGTFVYDEVYGQWSQKWGWASMFNAHGPIFIFWGCWLIVFFLFVAVAVIWVRNAKTKVRNLIFPVWLALLVLSVVVYLPNSRQYAAIAVSLYGPGEKSVQFQRDAVNWDSVSLLNALLRRGARIDADIPCRALKQKSLAVMARLREVGLEAKRCEDYNPVHST